MNVKQGYIYMTPDGRYIYQGLAASHNEDIPYWRVVEILDEATIFPNDNVRYAKRGIADTFGTEALTIEDIVAVPAYSYRVVKLGRGFENV